jgi:hypothetical protein
MKAGRAEPDSGSSSEVSSTCAPDSGLRRGLPVMDWENNILFLPLVVLSGLSSPSPPLLFLLLAPGVVLGLLEGSLASQSATCFSNFSRDLMVIII